jgi:hypothetical protein
MDEKSDQILNRIESQRERLGRNLDELETRVRRTADWRTHFDNNPMMMLGVALGGGILMGSIVGGRSSERSDTYKPRTGGRYGEATSSAVGGSALGLASTTGSSATRSSATSHQRNKASETIDHIKAALIAFGITKAKEFLNQAIPGFDSHLQEAERQRADGGTGSGSSPQSRNTVYTRTEDPPSPSTGRYAPGEPRNMGTPNASPV